MGASRTYWHDFETGRSGFVDGPTLPDGPLVEEITARDFYLSAGHALSCGWPTTHHERGNHVCPCGFIFPDRAPTRFHDDEALN